MTLNCHPIHAALAVLVAVAWLLLFVRAPGKVGPADEGGGE